MRFKLYFCIGAIVILNISDSILKQAQHRLVNYFHSKDLKYEISGEELAPTLHLVEIYFDTATFDDIEQDKKVKFETQLSLVGGTMDGAPHCILHHQRHRDHLLFSSGCPHHLSLSNLR